MHVTQAQELFIVVIYPETQNTIQPLRSCFAMGLATDVLALLAQGLEKD